MDRLFTPLLRRVYALGAVIILCYLGWEAVQHSAWNKERLYRQLVLGDERARAGAGFDLSYLNGEAQLVRALKSTSPEVRSVAVESLWRLWLRAGGHDALEEVQAATRAAQHKAFPEALKILTRVVSEHPDFAEGWNRRATLYWEMGQFPEAIADASRVVALNPNHFGAWQGMAMCHAHLGDMEEACRCMRAALRITPHDPALQSFLARCEELLRQMSPRRQIHDELI